MSDHSRAIEEHYTSGTLLQRIADGLAKTGKSLDTATVDDLKPVDEFHIGGVAATEALLSQLDIGADTRVIDIGCGIGGTARLIATRFGAKVHGVDLTPEFVDTARELSRRTGVAVTFEVGSGTDLPAGNDQYDLATMVHVGMNIADKPRLFNEVARVLRPGGHFAVYDVMKKADNPSTFPLPWSSVAETSFLATPDEYRAAAQAAGFIVIAERDRGDFAREFFAALAARLAKSGPPPLGLPVAMGADASVKISNMIENLKADRIAPVEMICRLEA